KDLGGDAFAIPGDLTKPANVTAVFEAAKHRFGGIDIAVNTTGKVLRKPIVDTTEEDFDSMFDINAKAAFFFIKEAGIHLNDGGKIITIVTSLLAAFTDGYSTYAGGKAPVEDFTRAAAKEFGRRGISVNALGPGPMDTPFFYGQETPERVAYHKSQSMNGELTKIEDIVPIVKFLATGGWWMTGQTIVSVRRTHLDRPPESADTGEHGITTKHGRDSADPGAVSSKRRVATGVLPPKRDGPQHAWTLPPAESET
ncbi:MAG TPA: SDR family oxidoreductase, partial [Terracidiphilus sp.]